MKKILASLPYVILIVLTLAVHVQASDSAPCPDVDMRGVDMMDGVVVVTCKVGDIQVLAYNAGNPYPVSVDVTARWTTKSGQQSRSFHATLNQKKGGQIGLIQDSPSGSITSVKLSTDVVICPDQKRSKCGAKYGPVY
jgi:hypothetical protein